jgi:NADPH2:quinone reductase
MQAIVLSKPGDAGHLKLDKKYPDPRPKKQEVVIRHTAVGINHFDIAFRKGQYKLPQTPAILGMEGVGIIEEVGAEVVDYKVGERVAYATAGNGSYAEKRAVHQRHLAVVPSNLGDVQVAATFFKGLTAHALLHRVYIAKRAKKIIVHAAAGGVGHILTQWAKFLGIEVIGTVGSDSKINFARLHGCAHVINYRKNNFVDEVAKITNHGGVGLVYDSVGKDSLEKSLECLWPMGMCVSYGESSGATEKLDLNFLATNSLYLTRPTMMLYKANRMEFVLSADEVFATLLQGIVKPEITTYALQDVAKAHQDLESRNTMGSLVIKF